MVCQRKRELSGWGVGAGVFEPRGGSACSFSQSAVPTHVSVGAAAYRQRATACAVAPRATLDACAKWVS